MVCILLTLMAFDAVIVMLIVMLSGARSHRKETYETDRR